MVLAVNIYRLLHRKIKPLAEPPSELIIGQNKNTKKILKTCVNDYGAIAIIITKKTIRR